MRVVSLLPSTTEILFAIGAGDEVVGRSSDCDWPTEVLARPVVSSSTLRVAPGHELASPTEIDRAVRSQVAVAGGLYRLHEDVLRALRPDVIVTQDLCAVCAVDVATVDEALQHLACEALVLTIDPASLDEVLDSVLVLGTATGHDAQAQAVLRALRDRLEIVASLVTSLPAPRLLVLEWTDPPFGPGHWVPDLVTAAGATPVLGVAGGRSAQLAWAEVGAARVDAIIVAPCGYHLEAAHSIAEAMLDDPRLPSGVPVWAVDADAAFVRPGPRLVDGVEAIAGIAHPEVCEPRGDLVRYAGSTSANTKPSRSIT